MQPNAKQLLSVGKSVCHVRVFTQAVRKTKACIARAPCRCSANCTLHCQSVSARAGRENLTSFGVTVVQGCKQHVSKNEVQMLSAKARNSYLKEGSMALCLL
jgi:hypothetical protein